jgi:hypothetical protein
MQRWTSKPLHFEYDREAPFIRADLELVGVDQRVPSFYGHLYLDNPRVRDDAVTKGRGYASSFAFFGHGEDCWGDEGHCEIESPVSEFDRRAEATFHSANVTVEITEALRQFKEKKQVRVTILAQAANPEVKEDVLFFDELMLVTYS